MSNKFNNNDRDERVTDTIDQGGQTAQLFLDASLAGQLGKSAPEKHPDFDGEHCVDCGIDIPAARLAHGRVRCVSCQGEIERKSSQYQR